MTMAIERYALSKPADKDLEAVFQQLIANPELGRERNEIKTELRSIPKSSHVIFYRIMNDHIKIIRVLHGSRDILKFL